MFDYIATFCKIISSQVSGAKKAILMALQGPGTGLANDTPETSPSEPAWGQLGVLARPLPQDSNGSAEAVCLRTPNGMLPVAYRDNRLSNAVPALESGQFSMVHYGGGFITVKGLDSTNTQTLIQLKTGPSTITMNPTGLGTVAVGDVNTAQSLPFAEQMFEMMKLLRRMANAPAVNGVAPSAVLATPDPMDPTYNPITGVAFFNSYGTPLSTSAPDETQMLMVN